MQLKSFLLAIKGKKQLYRPHANAGRRCKRYTVLLFKPTTFFLQKVLNVITLQTTFFLFFSFLTMTTKIIPEKNYAERFTGRRLMMADVYQRLIGTVCPKGSGVLYWIITNSIAEAIPDSRYCIPPLFFSRNWGVVHFLYPSHFIYWNAVFFFFFFLQDIK